MRKVLLVFFFVVGICPVHAQQSIRCDMERTDDVAAFENWLRSKMTGVAATSQTSIYRIPVVVHILHRGDLPGEGFNFPKERIVSQIQTLNQDFRRAEGTPGFNNNPAGDDSRIEFALAQIDPDGNPTDGIDRIDITKVEPPTQADLLDFFAGYSYWDPEKYLNIWIVGGDKPSPLLGMARFPLADLDGLPNLEFASDGLWVDSYAFGRGEINNNPNYDMGRTLTHEMGHFLGLLHTFGSLVHPRQCDAYTDYCDDTPPTSIAADGCPDTKPMACDGTPAMIENYMDGTHDRCMNIFTKDQIARMHAVLNNSPRRKSLVTSPVIERPDIITGIDDKTNPDFRVYPNPATDKLYVTLDESLVGVDIQITAHLLSGQLLFKSFARPAGTTIEIPISDVKQTLIVLMIDGPRSSFRQLISIL